MFGRNIRRVSIIEPLESRNLMDGSGLMEKVFDFSLPDVNPTSGTFGQNVSPSDYLGKVSAWYFGYST
ncbi:MAG: hypothetical protein KDB27_35410 [Planctomycetales bacterium]|nr:hypothetical protein [Planctomycetales bacterium]